jgi:hypothetical protein
MRSSLTLLLLFSTALLADDAPSSALKTACGPDQIKFSVKSAGQDATDAKPEPGKAVVYVIEEFDHAPNEWGRPTVRVGLDGSWVGANRGTSHISFSVDPGEHHICVDWQSRPFTMPILSVAGSSLSVEPGNTYFFRAHIVQHEGTPWTFGLDAVNADEGRILVAHSPRSTFHQNK